MEHKASLWRDCLHFFYPDCCLCCGQRLIGTEKILCADCLGRLTYTGYENHERNPLNMRMKTKIPIRGASALLHFNKEGVIQKLLHVLKYQKQSEVGLFLGRLAGLRLIGQTPFCEADFLVPVPIHPKKLRKRGYNQSMLIAQGMNEILRKEISGDLLIKQERTQSQTKKKPGSPLGQYTRKLLPESGISPRTTFPPAAFLAHRRCGDNRCHLRKLLPGTAQDSRKPSVLFRHSPSRIKHLRFPKWIFTAD